MPSILVLAASRAISAQELTALPSLGEVQLNDVTIATNSGNLNIADLAGSKFDTAVSTGPTGHHTVSLLGVIANALAPGGKLIVQEDGSEDSLKKNLMLSGFIKAQVSGSSEEQNGIITAEKPKWETGAKAAITLKPKAAAAAPAATWTLDADEDEELVDEDDLLTAEDLARPIPAANGAAGDDCEVGAGGGRKACDNCSCGRADGVVQKLTKDMIENPTSGCGSCSLGDAFRCGGCPYRGLPAFEMGKKIELPSDFLLADLE
jgi:anamorsin